MFNFFAVAENALISLGKQDPPKPGPELRNLDPIRLSKPKALETSWISAPTTSHKSATSLIKEIFVAKKLFEAYLIISAVSIVVETIGVSKRYKGRYICSCYSFY